MSIAIYPGSFDPLTVGQLTVIERCVKLFDEVVVCVMKESRKGATVFSHQDRIAMVEQSVQHMDKVSVVGESTPYYGLLPKYSGTSLVRCIRNSSDFDKELQLFSSLKKLDPAADTVYLLDHCDSFLVSSSGLRELARCGAPLDEFAPPAVAAFLKQQYKL